MKSENESNFIATTRAITLELREHDFSVLKRKYNTARDDYIRNEPLGEKREFYCQEIRRRTAELILLAATDKQCSLDEMSHCYDDLVAVGFSDLMQKCTMNLIFCRMLIKYGEPERARPILESLIEQIDADGNTSWDEDLCESKEIAEAHLRDC